MTRPDFVREMQKSLADQKRKADQNQREKLHDAEIISKHGLKKWDELHREVKSLSQQIGITFWPLEGYSFRLKNGDAELDVRLDGDIKYSGVAHDGSFKPVVKGEELLYSPRERSIETQAISVTVEQMGQFSVEEVAEHLVRIVVGPSLTADF
jgi:hypothetical protein